MADQTFEYMMLDRLKSDCNYFMGFGNYNEKALWAHSVEEQIAEMKRLWNVLAVKPEWLTMEQICIYENAMLEKSKGKQADRTFLQKSIDLEQFHELIG